MKIPAKKRVDEVKADQANGYRFYSRKSFWKGKMPKRMRINLSNIISVSSFRLSAFVN